jgi:hypothetical protein
VSGRGDRERVALCDIDELSLVRIGLYLADQLGAGGELSCVAEGVRNLHDVPGIGEHVVTDRNNEKLTRTAGRRCHDVRAEDWGYRRTTQKMNREGRNEWQLGS